MKTIEERVKEIFADRFCTRCPRILYTTCDRKLPGCCRIPEVRCMHEVIKNTIVSEREEFTRWHDPKEEMPESNHLVLTKWKYKDGSGEIISVGGFNGEEWDAHAILYPELFDIIGWREINE